MSIISIAAKDNNNAIADADNINGIEPIDTSTNDTTNSIINECCFIHEELCDICCVAEDYFSIVMLVIVTISFLIIVFNAYYVLMFGLRTKHKIDNEIMGFIIFLVYQQIIHALGLFVIIEKSTDVIEEVYHLLIL